MLKRFARKAIIKVMAAAVTIGFLAMIRTNTKTTIPGDAFCGIMFYELNYYMLRCAYADLKKRRDDVMNKKALEAALERSRKAERRNVQRWEDTTFAA